ncbi:MAG: hypothetical protein AAF619_08045 [Pseudomonadota bacterium]
MAVLERRRQPTETSPKPKPKTTARPVPITERDRDTLVSLAAYHVTYSKPFDALAILQLANLAFPNHIPTLRLMVEALIQTGDHDSAEGLLRQIEAVEAADGASSKTKLLSALIALGRNKLIEARSIFRQALDAASGGFAR